MSDKWIVLIPEDPQHVPAKHEQTLGRDRFLELAPKAGEIEINVYEEVRFFDCGANFERVTCPSCRAEIPLDWWHERMDEDFNEGGFRLFSYLVPCCGHSHTLDDLLYEWPQGFGRFSLEAMNPSLGKLNRQSIEELEVVLGTKLRTIYRHL